MNAKEAATQQDCRLLNIAPELRNKIYEYAFARTDSEAIVDLEHAEWPAKHLLLSCQQIYHEAKGIYQDAYRRYFTDTRFQLDFMNLSTLVTCRSLPITEVDFWRIEHLEVRWPILRGDICFDRGVIALLDVPVCSPVFTRLGREEGDDRVLLHRVSWGCTCERCAVLDLVNGG